MDNLLPNSISKPHISAIDATAAKRFSEIEFEKTLVMLLDTVSSNALPLLAEQFDVAGYKGYRLANTDEERRAVLKSAILLKRYDGTVWAVRQAMISVGYGGAALEESIGTVGDGRDWARFRVTADLGNNAALDATTPFELTALINEHKNARSHLLDISYRVNVSDTIPTPEESLDFDYDATLSDTLFTGGLKYNGAAKYDGTHKYTPGIESFNVTIL